MQDIVILLPGITGSCLADESGKEIWSPSGGAIWRAIKSLGGSVTGLELDGEDGGGVRATRLVPDITIVPGLLKIHGYAGVEAYLTTKLDGLELGKNFFPFPYDWRLDNRINARRLAHDAERWLHDWQTQTGNADARIVLIAHSMGGLISRYYLECLEGWKNTRTLITLGTPHLGSMNAVDFLVNGMKKGIGPFGLDLTPVLRSLPSVYQLLPVYPGSVVGQAAGDLITDVAGSGPFAEIDADRAKDARDFHVEIAKAQAANADDSKYRDDGYDLVTIIGIEQPTWQSVQAKGDEIELLYKLGDEDDKGDGTVPRVSASPFDDVGRDPRQIYAAQKHGALQNDASGQANLRGTLTEKKRDWDRVLRSRDMPTELRLDFDDVVLPDETLLVRAQTVSGDGRDITVIMTHMETGQQIGAPLETNRQTGWRDNEFKLDPGLWQIDAQAENAQTVSDIAVVCERAAST